jgi:hypothetical protein
VLRTTLHSGVSNVEPMTDVPITKKKSGLKGKGGLLMAGLVVILSILFFIDQKAPPPRDPEANPPVAEFAHLRAGEVTRVELKRPEGGFILAKQGAEWGFESPAGYRANGEKVDSWLKSILDDATVSRTIEGKPREMASYGLDKPAAELVLTKKGGETRTLQVGKEFKAPGESAAAGIVYAREAKDERLFMLSTSQVGDVKGKKADDLRDKRLVVIPEESDVQRVVLRRAAGDMDVRRQGEDKWELTAPFKAPADKFDVDGLVGQLKSAEADAFAENAATDLAKYGLDQPRLTVQVFDKKGERSVVFGKETKDGKVYAARQGQNEVMLVAKTTFESLDKKPTDLRERKLVTLESDKVTYVELKNAHGTVKLQKTSGMGGTEWQLTDAADPKQKKAKGDVVQTVINSVTGSAHKHVDEAPADLAKYGLDKPQITVTVNAGGGTSQVFTLGKKTPEGNYYAKGPGSAVFEVQQFVYNDLNVKPAAFQDTVKK